MSKGDDTKQTILTYAAGLASQVGLTGLTIGALAEDLQLSKSGLFAHFRSKETLQVKVLDYAATHFTDAVVRPALKAPRGLPRMRALFEHWVGWEKAESLPGGCVFVAAASELDDRPGLVRDRLVQLQREWLDVIATSLRKGIEAGAFRRDADPDQFAQDMYGIMLALHHHARLMGDLNAEKRARRAFETLLEAARQ